MQLNINTSSLSKTAFIAGIAMGPKLLANYLYVKPVEKWWEETIEQDRVWIYNKLPLMQIPEPPLPPAPQPPSMARAKRNGWIAFAILMGLGILIGLLIAATPTPSMNNGFGGRWAGLLYMIFPGAIPAAIAGLIVRAITAGNIRGEYKQALWAHEALQLQHQLWSFREHACHDLANGIKPIRYYEAIDVHPNAY